MKFFALVGLAAIALLWQSFVAVKLWGWFVTPLFHIAPPSQATIIGLVCLCDLFIGVYKYIPKEERIQALAAQFINPALLLLIGWIAA